MKTVVPTTSPMTVKRKKGQRMAKLTAKKRKRLKKGEFAEPGKRKYPIEDKAHARNALARVSQFGTAEEKANVRAAVRRKYPSIGKRKRSYGGRTWDV